MEKANNEIKIIDISGCKPRKIPPPTWRECIKKVWEVDPLKCPKCKGEMKIISFINEQSVIRQILEHLNLWNIADQRAPPVRAGPELMLAIISRQLLGNRTSKKFLTTDGPALKDRISHIIDYPFGHDGPLCANFSSCIRSCL